MSELLEILTGDGTYSLRSVHYQENFHSLGGALEETKIKFIDPSDLKRFKDKSLNVLDICFGLGYNSASLFNELIKQNSFLNWYALEIDKKPLEYSLRNKSFKELWDPKIVEIFEFLLKENRFEDEFLKCEIIWGEAREGIRTIPTNMKFDLIYLDGFSPQKCPQVWTFEFLYMVSQKLNPMGYLITYSSAAAVRKTFRDLDLKIFSIKSNLNSRNYWSQGTVAIAKFDENKFQNNLYFDNLSPMEEEHLSTKASIPYRDPNFNLKTEEIIQKRLKEQLLSNLNATKKWRDKWRMTKSTFKR